MPLYDENDQIIGTFGLSRDITDHKQAENLLTHHAEKLERFNDLAIGREKRMTELKNQINALLRELERPKECYPVNDKTESAATAESA